LPHLSTPRLRGPRAWPPLAGIQFQPAEFAKVVAVFIEASYIASCVRAGRPCRLLNRQWFFLGAMAILIEREPDGATASIVAGVPLVMLFFSNMRKREKLWMAGLSALAGCIICWVQPYRLARIFAMFNPWADPQGTGYQVVQSLQAIGSGGLTGMGLGVGVSKYHYLPEAHTDFAFAVVADFAVDGNAVVINQPLALFAAAQSLGLQIFEQLHGLSRDVFRRRQLCQRRPSEKKGKKKRPPCPGGAQKEHKPLPKLLHHPEAGQTRSAAGYKARCRSCGDNAESNLSLILNLPCSGQSSNRRQLQSMPSASRHLRRRAAQASR